MFWKNFNTLCEQKGKTPNSVCKELGFSNATATHWKNGTPPGSKSLNKIANYFGVSTDYLLGNTESAISAPNITKNEQELISMFRELTDDQRHTILITIKAMIADNDEQALEKKKDV